MRVLYVFDNGGVTVDRYTLITNQKAGGYWLGLTLSQNCDSPQGVSNWVPCELGGHLGKGITFSQLPKKVQDHALLRIS